MATVSITEAWLRRITLPDGVDRARYFDTKLPGFGVVVGRRSIVFIARHRVNGKRRDVAIGHWQRPGAGDDNAERWTEPRARREAMRLLGSMSQGVDPVAEPKTIEPTLRDAFDAHLEKLAAQVRAGKRSQATIDTIEKSKKYVEAWLDRPISELTGVALRELHKQIKQNARARGNAKNERGVALANRVITNIGTVWETLNKKHEGKLGTWNPARSVDKDPVIPKRVTVEDLPRWRADVDRMRNPIQRDGLMFALFTGLRSEDVRTVRWEHVDLEARTLHLPDPKGGQDRAFTIPLPGTCIEILERRKRDNANALGGKSDAGWAFPGIDNDGGIGPIGDLRQQVHEGAKHYRFPVEDVHTLRRTYTSIAQEAGISELDQHVLTNHSFASHNVNATYIKQHMDHLRACVDRIERAIKMRIER